MTKVLKNNKKTKRMEKQMKKIIALLLVLVMSFCMFSCNFIGGNKTPGEVPPVDGNETPKAEKVT